MMVPRYAKRSASREPQVNEALLCRVCSAKWKVDAELLHCFNIAVNVMIMFKMTTGETERGKT